MLLMCGILAPIIFVFIFLIDGATRVGYDPLYHSVSSLSLGDRGWLQISNFVISGLLMTAFAVGLRHALRPGRGSLWGPLLFGIFGVSLIFSGVFVMDPMQGYPLGAPAGVFSEGVSWHHTLHDVFGLLVFTSLPIASLVLSRRFFKDRATRGWFAYSLMTGVAMALLFLAYGTAWEEDASFAGLIQRITLIVGLSWTALLAWHFHKQR